MGKNFITFAVILFVLASFYNNFSKQSKESTNIDYSTFIERLRNKQIAKVEINGRSITSYSNNGSKNTTYNPGDIKLVDELIANNVAIKGIEPEKPSFLMQIFISWFPILLLVGLWFFFMNRMQGGGMGGKGGPMSFGKSKAKLLENDQIKVTFDDVAGVEEAKEEVSELVEFLRMPEKFQKLGGSIPRGVLLTGSPGTGKTLLAKAIAGEAEVPFFNISGSDFVEMFVGVGASRVRDMFEQAKAKSPCIIFIDEIDAVGRHRGAGVGGGNDEREQTLNQLLVEMDGFEKNNGIIVIAATNRPDVLDPALLRPGRFDRQVVVPLPDVIGREKILNVHMKKVPLSDNAKSKTLARGTPGFSGADLANLVNEAALFAARESKKLVSMLHFEKAKDKIMMGAERKSMLMTENERKLTAYHEAGHAIVGLKTPEHDPVYKVTIIPHGQALGVTMFLPKSDQYSHSKRKLESQISTLYGGRIAEEIIFGADAITTGASNDIQRATALARNMVTKWGFSEKLGPLTYEEEEEGEVFLGKQSSSSKKKSNDTNTLIDQEIRSIVNKNYDIAEKILKDNLDILHSMSEALLKYETIDEEQIASIMKGEEPTPPEDWEEYTTENSNTDNDVKPNEAESSDDEEKNAAEPNIGNTITD